MMHLSRALLLAGITAITSLTAHAEPDPGPDSGSVPPTAASPAASAAPASAAPAASPAASASAIPLPPGGLSPFPVGEQDGPPLVAPIAEALEKYLAMLRDPKANGDQLEAARKDLEKKMIEHAPKVAPGDGHGHDHAPASAAPSAPGHSHEGHTHDHGAPAPSASPR